MFLLLFGKTNYCQREQRICSEISGDAERTIRISEMEREVEGLDIMRDIVKISFQKLMPCFDNLPLAEK